MLYLRPCVSDVLLKKLTSGISDVSLKVKGKLK